MTTAFLKYYCSDYFDVESAGLTPGVLKTLVVEAMTDDIQCAQPKISSSYDQI